MILVIFATVMFVESTIIICPASIMVRFDSLYINMIGRMFIVLLVMVLSKNGSVPNMVIPPSIIVLFIIELFLEEFKMIPDLLMILLSLIVLLDELYRYRPNVGDEILLFMITL